MCGKIPKKETEVRSREEFAAMNGGYPTTDPATAYQNQPEPKHDLFEQLAHMTGYGNSPPGWNQWPDEGAGYPDTAQNRVSAPPVASVPSKLALVAGALWMRVCKHNVASCGILIAALVIAVVAGVLSALGD